MIKLLLDTCVWGGVRAQLQTNGYDVIYAGDWLEDPGDDEILTRAYQEQRILVTLDKDFGEIAIVRGQPHCGIIRLVNIAAKQQAVVCVEVLMRYDRELLAGAIATASPGRLRIRSN
jgi:predicted nuclease of predicted toxin-antitoxin system